MGEMKRRVLDTKSRELIAIVSLLSTNYEISFFKSRIRRALKHGWTRDEITEIVVECVAFVGYRRAATALRFAQDVFESE